MTKKIIFSGYYGSDNAGDEAILAALIKSFSLNIPNYKPVVISAGPLETIKQYERYNVESIGKTDLKNIIKNLRNADLFVSGGGSLLQDITGKKSVPYYLGLMILAKLFGVPVFFCAQGVGPIQSKTYKKLIKFVLSKVNAISVRDEASRSFLEGLDIKRKIHLTADLGYLLDNPYDDKARELLIREGVNTNLPLLGVSIRPWKDNYYLENLLEFLKEIQRVFGEYQIVLIPFKYPDDHEISHKFLKMGKEADLSIEMFEGKYLPEDLLGIISRLDILIGVRLHSLIFASIGNTLPLGISYDPKVEAFLRQLDLSPLGDIDNFDPKSSLKIIKDYLVKREEIERKLEEKNKINRQKAEKNISLALNLLGDDNE